ncbi:dnaJ-like protein subfamily B member 6-A-like protein, partial [Baffinella frigidus]
YYDLLGLDQGEAATPEQIRSAYKKSALKWHPDRNLDKKELAEKKFKEISEAYETLSDADRKAFYDRWGDEGVSSHREGGGSGA